ncbi:hypothetical protein C8Q77DRAFT_1162360 [Trametes polyzona]|nr:hypothetical protein C8Q77DRAFT_1162360 [Trametes polyzona]
MPTTTLPVEIIEHIIGLLSARRGRGRSLGACTLICHALLPAARAALWRDVALSFHLDGSLSTLTTAFLKVLDANPHISFYVRSLTLQPVTLNPHCDEADELDFGNHYVTWDRAVWDLLRARLPALRTLQLRNVDAPGLYDFLALVQDYPTLEALHLDGVHCTGDYTTARASKGARPWPKWLVSPRSGAVDEPMQRSSLRALSVHRGMIPEADFVWLVKLLELWTPNYVSLQSLDLRYHRIERWDALPSTPAFAPSLRSYGIAFGDVVNDDMVLSEGRDFIRRTLSALPRFHSLRFLCIEYNRLLPYILGSIGASERDGGAHSHEISHPAPFFLEELASVLAGSDASSIPYLEELTLVFLSSPRWLLGFDHAFARLAHVLVPQPSKTRVGAAVNRYPRFARLAVKTESLQVFGVFFGDARLEAERAKQAEDMDELVMPMLDCFVRAGVQVTVDST